MILQTFQVIRVIPLLPAVEGLRRDAKIATGEAGVLIMAPVVIEPLKFLPSSF
jgi:hypothetical protein